MIIDEHKEHLLDIMDSMPDDACGDWRDSLAYAISIMCKYQKIKEQVDIAIDKENFAISSARLIQIREIINGNDD